MRVVTYNIHGWRTAGGEPNWAAIGDVLEALDASVVGLNEVFYPQVVAGAAGPALEALAARLGMHFVFGPCLRWAAEHNMPATAYGNALLSRWPILASSAHHLTAKEEDKEGLLAGLEPRGLLEGRILLPNGQTLTLYVTHLDHTAAAARWVQLRVARTWLVRDRHRPHLVMGDFNAVSRWDAAEPPPPGDRAFQLIDAMEAQELPPSVPATSLPASIIFLPAPPCSLLRLAARSGTPPTAFPTTARCWPIWIWSGFLLADPCRRRFPARCRSRVSADLPSIPANSPLLDGTKERSCAILLQTPGCNGPAGQPKRVGERVQGLCQSAQIFRRF
jgi:endonuclease/exonuclease/phosphatase family metal-dependent hydrolase